MMVQLVLLLPRRGSCRGRPAVRGERRSRAREREMYILVFLAGAFAWGF